MKKFKYMCDFETSTEEWLTIDNGVARVWAGCIATIEETPKIVNLSNNIDDFMRALIKLGNIDCFFHNLKFDGEYIISWLFKNGYKYREKPNKAKTFSCVISDMGQWYEIQITHKVFNKRYVRTTIYDSFKKLPLTVKAIAKAFNLDEQKGEIDYARYRPVGYEITEEERKYIENDCIIVAKALYLQFDKGLEKITIGSDALNNFKFDLGGKKAFNYLYPTLSIDVDNDIRKSYKGGFTMVNPKYVNKEVDGISFDVNSLYPSVMYGNMGSLPYGYPRTFDGKYKKDKTYPLYIQKLSCEFKLKEGMIPTIQMKGNLMYCPTDYITESKGITDLTLTSVDLELFFKHYDVWNVEYVGGYMFKATSNIFRSYIDYWAEIKAKSTGGTRQLAKLMLNSLYGKFATNPKRQNKIPKYNKGDILLELGEETIGDPVYTALGSFITARARAYTITNSQSMFDNWVYSDTDSMYLTGLTEEQASKFIDIHPTKLGAWKLEHHFMRGKWLRPKTYIMKSEEDGLSIACAGMPENIKEDILSKGEEKAFELFSYGSSFKGKLQPKRVKGGVILFNTEFTIKDTR